MLKRHVLAVALMVAVATTCAHAQTIIDGSEERPASEFSLYVEKNPARYAGDYHFGESEGESTLTLKVKGTAVTGTLTYGVWDERKKGWKSKKLTFKGKIAGGMLIAGPWYGVFVQRGDARGLMFYAAPSDYVSGSFGYRM
jgi:hypothetical protein